MLNWRTEYRRLRPLRQSGTESSSKNEGSFTSQRKPKSDLYRDLLPLINSGAVDLLDNERLVQQLITLERRTDEGARTVSTILPGLTTISRTR
jgi:hypothetical protein